MTEHDPISTAHTDLADRPPPGWPKVIGILSIVFGLIAIVFGAGMTAMVPVFGGLVESQLEGDPLPPSLMLTPALIALGAVGALVNLLLVVAGFTTVARKPAGRTMHLVYAVLMLVASFAATIHQVGVIKATDEWAEAYPDNMMAQQMSGPGQEIGETVGVFGGLALSIAWPVFCIVWFGMVKRDPGDMGDTTDPIA